jgi:cell division protein FtsZ
MGGGTGTGGAPIIAKICKDLGVLTVGIVTTPFTNEGPKRMRHAEAGIQALRESVDTLLVISNDKVRHQYGNLKVREAFSKADDILATAAKCITDVITSNGQINVDFADVCTVMRNGGVAILGNAIADGEDRAQRAIEDAVNSPLLNDSEIRGAKWILINITSAEGDNEITMDEEDTIMSYLREQAGDDADVIKGIGFDESLGNKIGVTIIATGFEHKDPFKPTPRPKQEKKPEDKVVMKLEMEGEEKKLLAKPSVAIENKDPFAPTLVELPATAPSVIKPMERQQQDKEVVRLELKPENIEPVNSTPAPAETSESVNNNSSNTGTSEVPPMRSGSGFLSKPANIYADLNPASQSSNPAETKSSKPVVPEQQEFEMKLVMKDEVPPAADEPRFPFAASTSPAEITATPEDADEQKRRAQERIQKLRNLSFNINSADASSEFDSVPAYVRKNMEQSGNASIESFYSKYTVKSDENDKGQISSINTFLDGKKPD